MYLFIFLNYLKKFSLNDLIFGTDEEKALKRLQILFQNLNSPCVPDIWQRISKVPQKQNQMNEKMRKEIFDDVFSPSGLAEADTTVDFSEKVNEIEYNNNNKKKNFLPSKVCLQHSKQ